MNKHAIPLFLIVALSLLFVSTLQGQIPTNAEEFREAATLRRTFLEEFRRDAPSRQNPENRVSPDRIRDFVEALRKQPKITDGKTADLLLAQYRSLFSLQASEISLLFLDAIDIANVIEYASARGAAFGRIGYVLPQGTYISETNIFPIRKRSELIFNLIGHFPRPTREDDIRPPFSVLFSRLGLYDLAWQVQMETGKMFFANTPRRYWQNNPFYLNAANNAYRAGNKELAWSFLMLAAVFDEERFFESAMATAQLWIDIEAGKAELPEADIVQGNERKHLFLSIVARYQEMNAHPRAWLFIEDHKNEFDDADALIKAVKDDWLEFVEMITHPRDAIKIVLYGVQLYPDGADPLSVSLPWPLPDGSVERAKEQLRELTEKIREDEKTGFRTWHYVTEENRVNWTRLRAKYISLVNNVLTLENENGEKVSFEFETFSGLDHNYISRRIEVEKLTPQQ